MSSINDGGMNCLQISNFDSNFYVQKVWISHLDVKVENGEFPISTFLNLIFNDFY